MTIIYTLIIIKQYNNHSYEIRYTGEYKIY